MEFDVQRIAKLAMLQFTGEEAAAFEKEFAAIVGMVENLPELDSAGTLLDENNTMEMREDVVVPSLPRNELMKNVPHAIAGCVVVPKTVE